MIYIFKIKNDKNIFYYYHIIIIIIIINGYIFRHARTNPR